MVSHGGKCYDFHISAKFGNPEEQHIVEMNRSDKSQAGACNGIL